MSPTGKQDIAAPARLSPYHSALMRLRDLPAMLRDCRWALIAWQRKALVLAARLCHLIECSTFVDAAQSHTPPPRALATLAC